MTATRHSYGEGNIAAAYAHFRPQPVAENIGARRSFRRPAKPCPYDCRLIRRFNSDNLPVIHRVLLTNREMSMATKGGTKSKTPMTPKAVARIQSATAKTSGGVTPKGSFASRAQSVNAKAPALPGKVTGTKAAKAASTVLSSTSTGKSSKSAAASALSQAHAPKKITSTSAASAASKVLRDGRTGVAAKRAAGSALAQKESSQDSALRKTQSTGPRIKR